MVGDGIHRNGEGQQVTRHDENKEGDIGSSNDFATPFPCQNLSSIGHRGDLRVSQFHLSHDVSGVSCEQAEANKKNDGTVPCVSPYPYLVLSIDIRDKAQTSNGSGQGQNAQRNGFGNHDYKILESS